MSRRGEARGDAITRSVRKFCKAYQVPGCDPIDSPSTLL